jgi:hypothetical protein
LEDEPDLTKLAKESLTGMWTVENNAVRKASKEIGEWSKYYRQQQNISQKMGDPLDLAYILGQSAAMQARVAKNKADAIQAMKGWQDDMNEHLDKRDAIEAELKKRGITIKAPKAP